MAENAELYRALKAARDRHRDIQDELDRHIAEIRQQFAERLAEAAAAVSSAERGIDEAKSAAGVLANADMPTHLLYEWKRDRRSLNALTGRKGRYEVRTLESQFASTPHGVSMGERFIRLLKKDGTPSLRHEWLGTWRGKWLPEGEDPNHEKDAAAE